MESRNIYLVQDSDRSMYVLAYSWQTAVEKWQKLVIEENKEYYPADWQPQPQGISLVAETDDIIF